jgi:hypothetical protein
MMGKTRALQQAATLLVGNRNGFPVTEMKVPIRCGNDVHEIMLFRDEAQYKGLLQERPFCSLVLVRNCKRFLIGNGPKIFILFKGQFFRWLCDT